MKPSAFPDARKNILSETIVSIDKYTYFLTSIDRMSCLDTNVMGGLARAKTIVGIVPCLI